MDSKKRILTGTNSVVIVILTIGLAILANLLVNELSVRPLDLTQNKIYSLSDASVNAVRNADEPIHAKFFVTPEMPPPFHQLQQRVIELLRDYESASDGNFTFDVIIADPNSEAVAEEAMGLGIRKSAIQSFGESEISARSVYKGVAFVQGSRTEVVDNLVVMGSAEFDSFEYDFTRAILNVQAPEPRTIGLITGLGGPAAFPQFVPAMTGVFDQLYGELLKVEPVDLSAEDATVPDHIDALVAFNLDGKVPPRAFWAVDQYLQRGGSFGIYQSATALDEKVARQLMEKMGPNAPIPDARRPIDFEFGELLTHYGIQMRQDVIIDRENALATGRVETPTGPVAVSHPANFTMTDIDRSVPFTQNIYAVVMPGPSSIRIRDKVLADSGAKATVVVESSAQSVRRPEPPRTLQYQQFTEADPSEIPGPHPVAVIVEGTLPSFYSDNPLPEGVAESQLVKEPKPARILAVGNAEFFNARPAVGFNRELARIGTQFLLGSLEWLAQDDALADIRGKAQPRLVGEVPLKTKRQIQYINIVFVPAVFALLGWGIYSLRRRRRSKLERGDS